MLEHGGLFGTPHNLGIRKKLEATQWQAELGENVGYIVVFWSANKSTLTQLEGLISIYNCILQLSNNILAGAAK